MFKIKMKPMMRKTITLLFIYHPEMSVTIYFQAVMRKTAVGEGIASPLKGRLNA
jgi:hypothetical protein